MAFPIIWFDSNTGSDTLASGAGPGDGVTAGPALTGAAASTSADGLTVTLDGAPDLANVATDGSHVLFLNDATAGNRNFAAITAKDNAAKTVTVATGQAFGASLAGKAWAIGGRRLSLDDARSRKLFDNNSTGGISDAMSGWTVQLASGHSGTVSGGIVCRRSADTSVGRITLRGESGASIRPLLSANFDGTLFSAVGNDWTFRGFEARNTAATRAASVAFLGNGGSGLVLSDVKVAHPTNSFFRGVVFNSGIGHTIEESEVAYCRGNGVEISASHVRLRACSIHHNNAGGTQRGGVAINNAAFVNVGVLDSLIHANTGAGISDGRAQAGYGGGLLVAGNVVHGNTGDGLYSAATAATTGDLGLRVAAVQSNQITGNGGYGIDFADAGVTAAALAAKGTAVRDNNFGSGATANATGEARLGGAAGAFSGADGNLAVDPGYADAAGGNFAATAPAIRGSGWPTRNIGVGSATRTYRDIGMQHQDSGAGGSVAAPIFASPIFTSVRRGQ